MPRLSHCTPTPVICCRYGETKVKNENVATLTSAPIPAVVSSWGWMMAWMPFHAPPRDGAERAAPLGMHNARPSMPTTLRTPMDRKTTRHDQRLPRYVPIGTPNASARVNPIHTTDSARPDRCGSTSRVAASEATAMKTPWPRPTTKRMASSVIRLGEALISRLPSPSNAVASSRICRSRQCATRAVMNGAPMAAPSA